MTPTGTRQRLVSGILWNVIALIASRGSALVATIVVARMIGTTGFGELGIIQSTVGMFGTFAGMGLGLTATRYVAEYKNGDPLRAGRVVALTGLVSWYSSLALAIVLVAAGPWLASTTLANPELGVVLQLAAPLLLFSALTGAQGGILAGFEAFKVMARIGVLQGLSSFPLIIGGVYLWGVKGAVVGLGLNSFCGYVLNRRAIRTIVADKGMQCEPGDAWREKTILTRTAIPSVLTNVMVGPVIWVGNTLVVNEPSGYAQLGIFNAANQFKIILAYFPTLVGNVLLPMLSERSQGVNKKLEEFNYLGNWLFVTIIGSFLMALPEIASWFYGKNYVGQDFNVCLALMMMVSIVLAFKEGIARKLVIDELLWWAFFSNFVWSIIFIAFVFLFRAEGGRGLAYAYLISYVANLLVFVPFYLKNGVITKEYFATKKVFMVWLLITLVLVMAIFGVNVVLRVAVLLLAIGYCLMFTKKIVNS